MASFSFVGILFGALLATLVGKIFHLILPHLGASDPLIAWALSPICGFILVSIIFMLIGFKVHRQVEVFYKHKAGELRNAMWLRLNTRAGIYIGLLNGAAYIVLISFVIFNLSYLTTQVAVADNQPLSVRTVNALGNDLQKTGMARVAAGVGTLPPNFYKFSDLTGFLMQNPKTASRLADYPGLTSLWQRDDMLGLVTDSTLTNALAAGTSLGDILNEQPVQDFLKNKDLSKNVEGIFVTNIDDLMTYLKTGNSATYNDKLIGHWELNISVTLAWWRQGQPNVQPKQMKEIRNLWTQAYGQTRVLATGDKLLFVKNYPSFTKQAPFIDKHDWKGDWSADDATNYTLHINLNGDDKFMAATADTLRLTAKDGKTVMVFDRVD